MPRRRSHPPVAPEDLLGPAEVLALVGWRTHKSITDAESNNDFPPPVRVLQGTRIWDRADVLAWLKREGRDPQGSTDT
jgi:predicted DNA-binding transcriptional regulator AlpA